MRVQFLLIFSICVIRYGFRVSNFFTFNNFIGIFLELEPCLINIPFETIGGGDHFLHTYIVQGNESGGLFATIPKFMF